MRVSVYKLCKISAAQQDEEARNSDKGDWLYIHYEPFEGGNASDGGVHLDDDFGLLRMRPWLS